MTQNFTRRSAIATFGAAAFAATTPARAADFTLKVSNYLPPRHGFTADFMAPWAAELTERTNGAVAVELFDATSSLWQDRTAGRPGACRRHRCCSWPETASPGTAIHLPQSSKCPFWWKVQMPGREHCGNCTKRAHWVRTMKTSKSWVCSHTTEGCSTRSTNRCGRLAI